MDHTTLGLPRHYEATARPAPLRPPLRGDASCDVCVVGAGYTGLWTALHLARRGAAVLLLEQDRVGAGASGRNGGQVLPGYAADLREMIARLGPETAVALWRLAEESRQAVLDAAAGWGVVLGRGQITAATSAGQLADLTEELAAWRAQGYDQARAIGRDEIRALVDSPLYAGGVVDAGAAHLQPLDLARAIAAAVEQAGGVIHEATPVTSLKDGVHTPGGVVRCRRVVLCGNAYLRRLMPWVERRLVPVTSHVCVTEPLAERLAAAIPSGMAVADASLAPDYYRPEGDRLVFGAGGDYWRPTRDPAAFLRRRIAAVFPQLGPVALADVWSGRVAVTASRLPLLTRRGSVWAAAGYAGHGTVITALAGRLLAESVLGDDQRFSLLAGLRHLPFPGGPLRLPLVAAGVAWHRLSGRRA